MISESPEIKHNDIEHNHKLWGVYLNMLSDLFSEMPQKLPGSIMLRQQTRKYFPQAVPRSTLSGNQRQNTTTLRTVIETVKQQTEPQSKFKA
jgi:hypothetical protein